MGDMNHKLYLICHMNMKGGCAGIEEIWFRRTVIFTSCLLVGSFISDLIIFSEQLARRFDCVEYLFSSDFIHFQTHFMGKVESTTRTYQRKQEEGRWKLWTAVLKYRLKTMGSVVIEIDNLKKIFPVYHILQNFVWQCPTLIIINAFILQMS